MTTTPRTCIARKVFKMTTDTMDDQALIALADELYGGLDSLDLGDAMGALCELAEKESSETGETLWVGEGFTVTMSVDWELFEWSE